MSAAPANRGSDSGGSISLARLLVAFLKIGSIGFGGGMAVISLMEREFVGKRKLLAADEFVHGVGLGQILGSFAVNAAFFIGYRLLGTLGGILSATVFLLPSAALVVGLSHIYFRYHSIPALQGAVAGLGPVVIALILNAGWSVGRKVLRTPAAVVLAAAALAAGVLRINAAWVLVSAGALGYLISREGPDGAAWENPDPSPRTKVLAVLPPAAGLAAILGSIGATFLKIGLVFFGGGFVLLPLLHDRLVTDLRWLSAREFLDGVAISNLTPGPIAVLATFAGYRAGGVFGAVVATIAIFTPGIGLMMFLSRQYERYRDDRRVRRFLTGVNPAVTGLVLSAAVLLGRAAMTSWRAWLFCGVSLYLLGKLRWHPAPVLAIGAAAGYLGALP